MSRNPKPYGRPMRGREFGRRYQEGGRSFGFPKNYPPTDSATEVWNWGQASGNYSTEITGDTYIAGGTNPSISYSQPGPPGTNMFSTLWVNDATFNSHHTAPGTTSGQSSGPVDSSLQIGSSSFKFYLLIKPGSVVDSFYYIMDHDLQENGSTFNEGYQIYVSTAGLFAPCSLIFLSKDSNGDFPQFHAKTGGTTLFEDNQWGFVEMIFNRSLSLPVFKLNNKILNVQNTFSGPAVDEMGSITPTNGIRFAMREFSETATGRTTMNMAAAVFSKDLTYVWK